jgi:hypothetical protein
MKRSDLITKLSNLNADESTTTRESQFLMPPPSKKQDIFSPKIQKGKTSV